MEIDRLKKKALVCVWKNMKARCFNKSFPDYKRYGERGISICEEWKNNRENFVCWALANGYKKGLTIDRIDNNGDYSPTNCRLATRKEQAHNRRTNKWISFNGMTMIQRDWERFLGLKKGTIVKRIREGGYTPEQAIQKSFL